MPLRLRAILGVVGMWGRSSILALFPALFMAASSAAACDLAKVAEVPVEIVDNIPVVPIEINGQEALLIASTSGSILHLTTEGAKRLGVEGTPTRDWYELDRRGRRTDLLKTTLRQMKIGGLQIADTEVLIGGKVSFDNPRIAGAIGLANYSGYELEIDIAGRAIRFFKSTGCEKSELIYWEGAYSVAPLGPFYEGNPSYSTEVGLNGRKVAAAISLGIPASVVNLDTARSVGVSTTSPGVTAVEKAADTSAEAMTTWIATFGAFSIGDEAIRNTKLLIGEVYEERRHAPVGSRIAKTEDATGMWLAADFFRAHRVLLSGSQRKMYVSYRSGPVFRPQINGSPGASKYPSF
jgi:predicted aspartyl protease